MARRAGVFEATASRVLTAGATSPPRPVWTATVALVVHPTQHPAHGEGIFAARVLDGVAAMLHGRGYDLLYPRVDDAGVGHLASLLTVHRGRTDGVLLRRG